MAAVVVVVVALVGAGWLDLRSRTVPNRYWLWVLAALAPALAFELAVQPGDFLVRIGVAAGWAAAVFALWMGGVFRGGDAKGLMIAGLGLSSIGYYAPMMSRVHPVFDALPVALLLGEGLRRAMRWESVPFFAVYAPVQLVTLSAGGLLWWPLTWLL